MQRSQSLSAVFSGYRAGRPIAIGGVVCRPTVVITGASQGLGAAFAQIIDRSSAIVLIARHKDDIDTVAEGIAGRHRGHRSLHPDGSLMSRRAPKNCGRSFEHALYADVLINNAGVGFGGRFDILDEAANV